MDWIASRHETTSRRRANRLDVIVIQNYAVVCEIVDAGRRNLIGSVETDVIPALREHIIALLSVSEHLRDRRLQSSQYGAFALLRN